MSEKVNGKILKVNKSKLKKDIRKAKKRESSFKMTAKAWIILLCIALAVLGFYLVENYHVYGIVFNKNITSEDTITVETLSTENIVIDYDNELLVFSNNTMTAYNKNGNEVWAKKLEEAFQPQIHTSGKYIQLINEDTGYVYVYKGKYEIARIKVNGSIISGKINENGTSIIEYSLSGYKTIIGVYNKSGEEKYQVKLSTDMVSEYMLSDNEKYLAYSYVDISGISVVTKIDIVDLKENSVKEVASKSNTLAHKLLLTNSNLTAVFDDSILKYSIKGEKIEEYPVDELNITDIDIDNSYMAYVASSSETGYTFNVIKLGKTKPNTASIVDSPKHFMYKDNIAYIVFGKEIKIYNMWGVNIKNFKSDTIITKPVIFNSGKSVAFTVTNKIFIFTI